MLSSPSPLGIHVIAGSKWSKVPTALFTTMSAAFGDKATLLAVQRRMCVNSANVLMMDWFGAFNSASLGKLFSGKWVVDKPSSTSFDLWADFVSPLYLLQKGSHSLNHVTLGSAQDFFSSEVALRLGRPYVRHRPL
jgi:hypothetical protein